MKTIRFLSLLAFVLGCFVVKADEIVLVTPDKPTPVIVLAAQAEDQERLAAKDLKHYLGKMTGREFAIVEANEGNGFAIHIGHVPGNEALQAEVEKRVLGRDGFVLDISPGAIRIAGGSKFGTSYGVYELLERLGVRWFFPGEWGEVVPHREEVTLPEGRSLDKPVFSIREMHTARADGEVGDWFRRNRHNRSGFFGHNGGLISPRKYATAHPEWYAEIDGKRRPEAAEFKLCHSNNEMVEQAVADTLQAIREREADVKPVMHNGYRHLTQDYTVISISPTDGGGFCRCKECLAMGSVSDRLQIFANRIAAAVRKEYPNYKVGYYSAYSEAKTPPTVRAEPGVVVFVTTWDKNFFTPLGNLTNEAFREKLESFSRMCPAMAIRDFDGLSVWWGNGPLTLADVHSADYQWYHQHHVQGIITEAESGWGPRGYSYYLTSKLWWNPNADLKALKTDFIAAAYGEAAEPMKVYHDLLDDVLGDPSPSYLRKMREKLEEAWKLAVNPGVKMRINYLRAYYYLEDIYQKSRAGDAKPEDIAQFYQILKSIDPAASPFSSTRRGFPKDEGSNLPPLAEKELEGVLAHVELPSGGKDYAGWMDSENLRLKPIRKYEAGKFGESLGMLLRYGPATLLIYAEAGEHITVKQNAKAWNAFETAYALQGPELLTLAEGVAKGEAIVDIVAPSEGIYTLTLSPGGRYPNIDVSNRWVVVKAASGSQKMQTMGRVREAYVYVPKGTKEFAIVSRAHEALAIQVDGPISHLKARPRIEQKAQVYQQHDIAVAPEEDGKIWRISFEGGLKDIFLQGIPPFLASHPSRLLVPENSTDHSHATQN